MSADSKSTHLDFKAPKSDLEKWFASLVDVGRGHLPGPDQRKAGPVLLVSRSKAKVSELGDDRAKEVAAFWQMRNCNMAQQHGRTDAKPDDATESVDEGGEPKLKRKEYEKHLRELQTELCSLQDWVKQTGAAHHRRVRRPRRRRQGRNDPRDDRAG